MQWKQEIQAPYMQISFSSLSSAKHKTHINGSYKKKLKKNQPFTLDEACALLQYNLQLDCTIIKL
jgi:hypothetical protein